MDVDRIVLDEVGVLLAEHGRSRDGVSLDDALEADLGLSSLEIVRLIERIAGALALDAFASALSITDIRTVEDLCRVYHDVLAGGSTDAAAIEALRQRQADAQARRAKRMGSA